MSGLSNIQIMSIARLHYHTKDYFGGCFCIDTLPSNVVKYPTFIICNSDPSWSGGKHWLTVCLRSPRENGEFFDPLGEDLTTYDQTLLNFISRNSTGPYKSNNYTYQGENSDKCGHFCLWFGDMRCKNVPFEKCLSMLDRQDLTWNDHYVTEYVMQHMRPGRV